MTTLAQEFGEDPAAKTDPAAQQVPLIRIQNIGFTEQLLGRDVHMVEFVQRVCIGFHPVTDIHDREFCSLMGWERCQIDFHRLYGFIGSVERTQRRGMAAYQTIVVRASFYEACPIAAEVEQQHVPFQRVGKTQQKFQRLHGLKRPEDTGNRPQYARGRTVAEVTGSGWFSPETAQARAFV